MATKRITDLTEAASVDDTDYVVIDSTTNGTQKLPVSSITPTVTVTDDGNGNITVTIGGTT